tara:strand:- start:265 stop:1227 length:963 start_codon:yes stop_codon:yes gene_type:complete
MAERVPIPKTQRDISVSKQDPFDKSSGNPNLADSTFNRGTKTSFKGDTVKPLSIGIQDIDESIFYYFNNIIKPSVIQNGERLPVPIIYGAPEKWKSYQKDGYYRDNKGKIMAPIIMFKRTSMEKNRQIANKLDANNPNNFSIFGEKYSKRNEYDQFNVLNNRQPIKTFYASVVPDYLTLNYSCVVFTYYVEHLNKIVESIEYASDAYWGDPERFKFRAMIDSFDFQTEASQNTERIVRSTFNIKLNGYIVPEILQKDLNGIRKYSEKSKLIFQLETEMTPEFYTGKLTENRVETEGEILPFKEPLPSSDSFDDSFNDSYS